MKKIFSTLFLGACTVFALTSCVNDADEPDTNGYLITSPVSVGEVNTTIGELKTKYCSDYKTADFAPRTYSYYSKVNDDVVITGVVAANDISGNLYQTLLIRNIEEDGTDQGIILKIRTTCLYPYFKLGQRLKINLKGLWVGCYSDVATIGQPYRTSSDNYNLGPMLFNLCATNIELVGDPDPNAPELVPIDLTDAEGEAWLRASANKVYTNYPQLATVSGTIDQVQGDAAANAETGEKNETETVKEINGHFLKLFAPYALRDGGFGVNRTISLKTNNSNVILRTSTDNDISFYYLPSDTRSYTGLFTYSSYEKMWQIQLRSISDVSPALPTNAELEAELAK